MNRGRGAGASRAPRPEAGKLRAAGFLLPHHYNNPDGRPSYCNGNYEMAPPLGWGSGKMRGFVTQRILGDCELRNSDLFPPLARGMPPPLPEGRAGVGWEGWGSG